MLTFNAIQVSERVYWVGAVDAEIQDFHGYKTSRGTTYNAFLVMADEPILIDTVKAAFFDEMIARISSIVEPKKIKTIISNHAEMDHSGSLPKAIELIKPEKIFSSKVGVQALNAHFHFDVEIIPVENGSSLNLYGAEFTFVETRMLHWPDSMFTYLQGDGVLFSQDGFGMHLATHKIFADENSREVMRYESAKYFANILMPYCNFVSKLCDAFPSLNLDIKLLAPDHGPLFRTKKDIEWVMNLWCEWAKQEAIPKVVITYATMWHSTEKMAHVIAEGVAAEGVEVKLMPLSASHRSDIATEVLEAGALLVGSPTLNQQMFPTIADTLCYLKGLKPKNLIGQSFGSFGWGGESIKLVQDELTSMGINLIGDMLKVKYVPDDAALKSCRALGQQIAKELKNAR